MSVAAHRPNEFYSHKKVKKNMKGAQGWADVDIQSFQDDRLELLNQLALITEQMIQKSVDPKTHTDPPGLTLFVTCPKITHKDPSIPSAQFWGPLSKLLSDLYLAVAKKAYELDCPFFDCDVLLAGFCGYELPLKRGLYTDYFGLSEIS
jgi:hypothetical protein